MSTARRITIGTAQLTLSNIFVRMLALVSMPILTRLLTPGAYGTAAMAMTLTSFISSAALAGADISYIRAYHAKQFAPAEAVEAFTWRYSMAGAIVAAIAVEVFWGPLSRAFSLPAYAGWLVSACIVLSVASIMSSVKARLENRNGILSIATAGTGIGSTAAGIGLAYWGWRNEFPLLISMVALYLLPVLMLGMPPLRTLLTPTHLNAAVRQRIFGIGAGAVVAAPAFAIMTLSDRWFMGYSQGTDAAGIYSVAYSVAIAGMTVNSAGLYVWTPEATRLFESGRSDSIQQIATITEVMIAVLAWVWLGVAAAGGDVIRLLTTQAFYGGAAAVPLIAGAVFFHGIIQLANTVYVLEKRVNQTIWWLAAGAAVSLLLNAAIIPYAGMYGAAVCQLLSFGFVALGLSYHARRIFAGRINWPRILLTVLTALATAFAVIPPWSGNPLASLLLKFPAMLLAAAIIASYFGAGSIVWALLCKTKTAASIKPASGIEPLGCEEPGQ